MVTSITNLLFRRCSPTSLDQNGERFVTEKWAVLRRNQYPRRQADA